MISSFYQYHSGCVFYYRRIARKAEAGRGGILRSINRSATCPAMWRLTFSGGGHLVRLSANGCQPHRPNTALLFCAAGYRPGLLRTFREHDLNFYSSVASASSHTSMPSSSSCFGSTFSGASVIRSDASFTFGNAITSRMLSCFAISITRRSRP